MTERRCLVCGTAYDDSTSAACPTCGAPPAGRSTGEPDASPAPAWTPLGVGKIIEQGLQIATAHWRVLIPIAIACVAPLALVGGLLVASAPEVETNSDGSIAASDEDDAFATLGLFLAAAGLQWLGTLLAAGASFRAVLDAFEGRQPDYATSLGAGLRRLPALVLVAILAGAAVFLGFLALLIPGIWLAVSFAVVAPVVVAEHQAAGALGRSFRLVKGRWWPTFGLLLVVGIMTGVVGIMLDTLVHAVIPDATSSIIVSSIVRVAIVGPFAAATTALLYLDLRGRKANAAAAPIVA